MKDILLVGKPNSGKSLLFNRLTGLNQKVANFPGVTVELKTGLFENYNLIDFPGIYSLNAVSRDEEVAVEQLHTALHKENTSAVVCNLDATRLERSLVFGLQAQDLAKRHNKPFVFSLNMIDELERYGHQIDIEKLQEELGSPIFPVSARTLKGFPEFKEAMLRATTNGATYIPTKSIGEGKDVFKASRKIGQSYGLNPDILLKNQNRIDRFLLNNIFGGVIFLIVMLFLFQSIFTWASPLMDFVETSIGWLAVGATSLLGEGVLSDFVNDALLGGLGSFLVFVPQIMVLTLIIGVMEDSGYLARAAVIAHRPLSLFGLSGKSFIPYLSAHACAIPAIMAARTIESPRKRLLTMITIPLMSCSARLPVYALLVSVLIPEQSFLWGIINLRGLAFFGLYLMGIITALVVALMISKFSRMGKSSDMPFILELPPYRLPHWKPLFVRVLSSGKKFIVKAGPIIFIVSVVIWFLGYFPNFGEDLGESYLGSIGKFIEPLFAPLGLDWRYGVAILASFLAREVFVGTLGTLFGIEGADSNVASLAENIQQDGLALGTGIGLLVFYVIALQCVATVAMLKSETGSQKIAWGLFVGYGALAYSVALLVVNLF